MALFFCLDEFEGFIARFHEVQSLFYDASVGKDGSQLKGLGEGRRVGVPSRTDAVTSNCAGSNQSMACLGLAK